MYYIIIMIFCVLFFKYTVQMLVMASSKFCETSNDNVPLLVFLTLSGAFSWQMKSKLSLPPLYRRFAPFSSRPRYESWYQILECKWWLHGGLMYIIWYLCTMYIQKSEVLGIKVPFFTFLSYFLYLPVNMA